MHTLPFKNRYILCQFVPNDSTGKTDKIPLSYKTLKAHSIQDPSIYMTYDEAKALLEVIGDGYGIGFVLLKEDKYFCIDIDNAFTCEKWSDLACELYTAYQGSYIEISNSKRGIHIIGRYEGDQPSHACKNSALGLELYTETRFIALAEINPEGSAETICTGQLIQTINKYFTKTQSETTDRNEWTTESDPLYNVPENNQILLDSILNRIPTGQEIFGTVVSLRDLFDANVEVLAKAYPSSTGQDFDKSRADAALAYRLNYFTGGNCERVRELMQLSRLKDLDLDKKWDREDYLAQTITKARAQIKKCFVHSHEHPNNTPTSPIVQQDYLLTIIQTHELFKGCVYVSNEHKVFMPNGDLLSEKQFRAKFGGFAFPMEEGYKKPSRNAWDCFNESYVFKKPQVDGCRFYPLLEPRSIVNHENKTYINTYVPIETKRVKAPVDIFLDWIRRMYPDSRDRQILLSYMAAIVQYKGIKFTWSILMQGVPGNGKSMIAEILNYCISDAYTHYPKASELTGRFNSWMYGKLLIIVEDLSLSHQALDTLKPMITGNKYEIEKKGVDKVTQSVFCNFIFNTNNKDGLQKSRDDRRIAPLFTAQQNKDDLLRDGLTESYFVILRSWLINQDGYAAINEFLCTYKISNEFNPATTCIRAPSTSATEEAIEHALDDNALRIREWVEEGQKGFRKGWVSSIAVSRKLEEINVKIAPRKMPIVLESIGYLPHPGLNKGRATKIITTDGAQSRLYIHSTHLASLHLPPLQIIEKYEEDQTL